MWRLELVRACAGDTAGAACSTATSSIPERRTLTLLGCDARGGDRGRAAASGWACRRVLVHNLLLLGAIAASGAAMFVLVVYLTGSRGAGSIAGIVFSFAPYRFEHYHAHGAAVDHVDAAGVPCAAPQCSMRVACATASSSA